VGLLPEEHVIRKVLNDPRDHQEPFLHILLMFLRQLDIDRLRGYDRGGDKPEEHEGPKGRKLRVGPDLISTGKSALRCGERGVTAYTVFPMCEQSS